MAANAAIPKPNISAAAGSGTTWTDWIIAITVPGLPAIGSLTSKSMAAWSNEANIVGAGTASCDPRTEGGGANAGDWLNISIEARYPIPPLAPPAR